MPFKIGNDSIGDIYVGSDKISKIYVGNDLVYSSGFTPLAPYFNFTGIDENGKFEYNDGYTGVPVAYAIGKRPFKHVFRVYTDPTVPANSAAYSGKYVYNTDENKWELCYYNPSNSTLTPAWVVVGETTAYTGTMYYFDENTPDPSWEIYEYIGAQYVYIFNSGFDPACFGGYDFSVSKDTEQDALADAARLGIATIVIPDTYNGLPVTTILPHAFNGRSYSDTAVTGYYAPIGIRNITLGANITTFASDISYGQLPFYKTCFVGRTDAPRSFVFNDKVTSLKTGMVTGVYVGGNSFELALPSTITDIAWGGLFGCTIKKLIISSPSITMTTPTVLRHTDYIGFIIFSKDVTKISGKLESTSGMWHVGDDTKGDGTVFLHGDNDPIDLSGLESQKSATEITIYTDCAAIRNFGWSGKNYTVTWKTLAQYEEDSA